MSSDLLQTVARFIRKHDMFAAGTHIVALSGGADSVALLLVMRALGYNVSAAHCHFGLRGAEADRDERFVSALCVREGVALHIAHFDTSAYAAMRKMSVETAARTLRYAWLHKLREDTGAADICVAHNMNDDAETVLMNIVRGSGIHGLAGIRPVNGYVKRPLLCVTRADIERFLAACGQDYVTDSTNADDNAERNKYRHHVLPLLEELNPQAIEHICAASRRVAGAEQVYDSAIEAGKRRVLTHGTRDDSLSLAALRREPSPACLLYEVLKDYGFSSAQVEDIMERMDGEAGALFASADYDLAVDRDAIVIARRRDPVRPMTITEAGTYVLSDGTRIRVCERVVDSDFVIPRDSGMACVDAATAPFPFIVRPAAPGDRFRPLGMRGTKLVSDYLNGRKRDILTKRRQTVVTDATERIVWIVGEGIDDRCRITARTLTAILIYAE